MNHYYTNNPNLKDNSYAFSYTFKGVLVNFNSASGVFAKKRVDFGTNVLLNNLDDLSNQRILDVGCGVGTIGVTLAKFYHNSYVEMIDINEKAVRLANENISLNKIKNAEAFVSNCYQNINKMFDTIVTNPPIRAGKEVVYEIVLKAIKYLNVGGTIYIVIQKKQGAESMMKKLEEVYGNIYIINKTKGYYIYKCVRRL